LAVVAGRALDFADKGPGAISKAARHLGI